MSYTRPFLLQIRLCVRLPCWAWALRASYTVLGVLGELCLASYDCRFVLVELCLSKVNDSTANLARFLFVELSDGFENM